MRKYIQTVWEVWTYDVVGTAKEGYEVNDRSRLYRKYPIRLRIQKANENTAHEFNFATPSTPQLKKVFQLTCSNIDVEGDDTTIYVNASHNGYPIGELHCVSHVSLSPIRK